MILRAAPSGFIEPCLPSRAERPPSGPGWVHEIKHDGFRMMVRRDAAGVRLITRNGHDWTDRYPLIAEGRRREPMTARRDEDTYVVEFRTSEGDVLAVSIPRPSRMWFAFPREDALWAFCAGCSDIGPVQSWPFRTQGLHHLF